MKNLRIISVFLFFLLAVTAASAQAQNAHLLAESELSGPVSRMVWNEAGNTIMLASREAVEYIELSAPKDSKSCSLSVKDPFFTALSQTGIAVSTDWQTISIFDPGKDEKAVRTIDPGFMVLSVGISKDGSLVLADSAEQIRTVVYNTEDGSVVYDLTGFETAAPVYDSSFSADSSYLVWHARGTLAVQNIAEGTFGKTISLWDFIADYELSPDNSTLAAAIINDDYENGCVIFFDPENGQELGRTILGKTSPNHLSYSADGTVLWASDAATVYRIDPVSFELQAQYPVTSPDAESERISLIASAPDGSSAAVLLNSGKVFLVESEK